jgi:hypothetical protein
LMLPYSRHILYKKDQYNNVIRTVGDLRITDVRGNSRYNRRLAVTKVNCIVSFG